MQYHLKILIGLKWKLMLLLLGLSLPVFSQSDSITLTYREYLDNIYRYHPVVEQADLQIDMGEAEMLGARGMLDPELYADWDQKNFDDKLYFQTYQATLRVPTVLGVDFVGGYENTEGVFLSPESNTDRFGLWNVGVEVNVLQGLIVNERRTALDQARVFQQMAQNEQQIILNDLLYDASAAYIEWQQYQYFTSVLNENIEIAANYLDITKQSYFGGEKTEMDTLEAFILYQDAVTLLQKNDLKLIKSRQNVENFLWFKDVPIQLQPAAIPESYDNPYLPIAASIENTNLANHPIILATLNKLSYFEIEQRLKREKLKPKLKVKYNPLLATSEEGITPSPSFSDFKWGFDFSMPLLMRSERADVQLGQIKLQDIGLELDNKRNELQNKMEASWLQQNRLESQLQLMQQNVENYRRLLEMEREKFRFGESSVFLLNKRQEKYIDGQLKLIETTSKQQVERLNFLYFSNQLLRTRE
ncbi:MAG: TolC family protein [Saprospiraceae bacterium]